MLKQYGTPFNVAQLNKVLFKFSLWVCMSCLLLLYLPKSTLVSFYIDHFVNEHNQFIGLGLIVALAYLACHFVNVILDELIAYLLLYRQQNSVKKRIETLDLDERALLREFFLRGVSTLTLPKNELVVANLHQAHILECVESRQRYMSQVQHANYRINRSARKYLSKQILGLPQGQLTEDDIMRLKNTRPKFIHLVKKTRRYAA